MPFVLAPLPKAQAVPLKVTDTSKIFFPLARGLARHVCAHEAADAVADEADAFAFGHRARLSVRLMRPPGGSALWANGDVPGRMRRTP